MKMLDRLAAVFTGVDHYTIALFKALLLGDLRCRPEKMAQQRTIAMQAIGHGAKVVPGNNQHMHRSLRVDIGEGVALIVFIDGGGWDAPIDDLAEEATHGASSVQECAGASTDASHDCPLVCSAATG